MSVVCSSVYQDRVHAGREVARVLVEKRFDLGLDGDQIVVGGLPRGGIPVACEVALALHAPLDVLLVRKLGVPAQPEVAMGAIGENDIRVINVEGVKHGHVTIKELAQVEARERTELERQGARYRQGKPRLPLDGKIVVIVDDGIATGSTAKAACRVARAEGASRVIVAVPVAPLDWTARLSEDADDLVCPLTPADFVSVGRFYRNFDQTTDETVIACLDRASRDLVT